MTDSILSADQAQSLVYHFTSFETTIDHILPNGTIKMNPFACVNDPHESRLDAFVIHPQDDGTQPEYQTFVDKVKCNLANHLKVLCTSANRKRIAPYQQDQVLFKPGMWTHYGDAFQGVCLVFDRERLKKSVRSYFKHSGSDVRFGPVRYVPGGKLFEKGHLVARNEIERAGWDVMQVAKEIFLGDSRQRMFLTKHNDWKPESEWRAIAFSSVFGAEYIPIQDSLKHVIVGMNFPEEHRHQLRNMAQLRSITARKLYWSAPQFGLVHL